MTRYLTEWQRVRSGKPTYWFWAVLAGGILLVFALLLAHGNGAPSTSPVAVDTRPQDGKTLVFADEFNNPTLDSTKWATCYDWRLPTESGCTNGGNFEQEWYTNDQVTIDHGNLVLTAQRKPTDVTVQNRIKTFDYLSGMINSGQGATDSSARWAGTYGYYEARIKFQAGQGIWPAFWLLPSDGKWPPEIDAMEFIGSEPGQILQTVHWHGAHGPQQSGVTITGLADYSADWHTYGVDWEPGRIDWYIDGKKTRSYTGPNVPDKPMEIILNLAVGGLLPGNADATTPLTSEMRVDYVHVFQSSGQAAHNN